MYVVENFQSVLFYSCNVENPQKQQRCISSKSHAEMYQTL